MVDTVELNLPILVTGAGGFVGGCLVDALTSKGLEVWAVVRDEQRQKSLGNKIFINADVSDPMFFDQLFRSQKFSTVYHLAARENTESISDIELDYRVNCGAVLLLLEAVKKYSPETRIIFASSSNVYGNTDLDVVHESSAPVPSSYWSSHKLLSEQYIESYAVNCGLTALSIRLPNLFGFHGEISTCMRMSLNKMLFLAITEKRVKLYRNMHLKRNFVHVQDACDALYLSSQIVKLQDRVYLLGDTHHYSFWEVSQFLRNLTKDLSLEIIDKELHRLEMRSYKLDPSRFMTASGWTTSNTFSRWLIASYRDLSHRLSANAQT